MPTQRAATLACGVVVVVVVVVVCVCGRGRARHEGTGEAWPLALIAGHRNAKRANFSAAS